MTQTNALTTTNVVSATRWEASNRHMDSCLVYLAAAKIEVDEALAPRCRHFRHEWLTKYEEWLTTIKDRALRAGVPLRAELLDLVYDENGGLNEKCERESLGFNATRLHPDLYMNELLVGMRVIRQVLPAILEKLGIEKTFKLDQTELRLDRPNTIQWGPDADAHRSSNTTPPEQTGADPSGTIKGEHVPPPPSSKR